MLRRATAGLVGAALVAAVAPAARAGSLYDGPAPRPGPDILYREPAAAPQLTNAGPWEARPILVSGAGAYRDGEFLYQDFLYDDHGARGLLPDPNDQRSSGTLENGTYPTGLAYVEQSRSWGRVPARDPDDVLHLDVENVAAATVHVDRARLSCDPRFDVATDGPIEVRLAGCGRTLTFG